MGWIGVIDPSGDFAGIVATLIGQRPEIEVRPIAAFDEPQAEDAPLVVVTAPGSDPQAGIVAARTAEATGCCTGVVIVAKDISTELMRAALKAGVSDVIAASDPATEIGKSIVDAYDAARDRFETLHAVPESGPEVTGGRVVTVFSTKGGVGKTVLSTNLGVALAKVLGLKTAIVDLDLQFGDVGIMLGLTPSRTIADVAASIERLDEDLLLGHMTIHDSGLAALLAPIKPEDAETITTGRISRILALLKKMYDVVIIDTSANLDEIVLTALDNSSDIYAITMMDVASIKNMRISLQKLQQLGYPDTEVHVVLNRADSKVWLQPAEVEKAIGAEVFAKIPSDRVVPRSVNKGTPVVLDEPKSDVAKAMVGIARTVARPAGEVATDVA